MNNSTIDFDLSLFVIGINYCKNTDVTITIQYGSIILRKNNILVHLVGSLDSSEIKQLIIPSDYNNFDLDVIKVWIPYLLINNSDYIFQYFDSIFHPIMSNKNKSNVSITRKIFNSLVKNKTIFLDKYFCEQSSDKFKIFKLQNSTVNSYLSIIVNGDEAIKFPVVLILRSGKGNEDL